MWRIIFVLVVVSAVGAGSLAGFFVGKKCGGSGLTAADEANANKQEDLKWARQIADTFLQALVDHEGGGALDLGSPTLRQRFGLTNSPDRFVRVNAIGNFYRFCGYNGYDLRLLPPANDPDGIPPTGKNLIVVVAVNHVLHFRIFDGAGKILVDTDETKLMDKAAQIKELRNQLQGLWPPHELTRREKGPVITTVESIVGLTSHPSPKDDVARHDKFTIDKEAIAPGSDEAIFRGILSGPNRKDPFSLVVTKDQTSGKWRVDGFILEDR